MSMHENTPSNRDPVYKRSGKASRGTEVNKSSVHWNRNPDASPSLMCYFNHHYFVRCLSTEYEK